MLDVRASACCIYCASTRSACLPSLPAAVGILGLQAAGAEAALTDPSALAADVAYKALGRPPSPSQRIAALHALAALAGAERSGRSGKLLSPAAESGLRVAVFEGGWVCRRCGWVLLCPLPVLAGT